MIFVCQKCLHEGGEKSAWSRAIRNCERTGTRMWVGRCDVCETVDVCAVVRKSTYLNVCRNLNPAEDDPDSMCSHPGHPDHYGDR